MAKKKSRLRVKRRISKPKPSNTMAKRRRKSSSRRRRSLSAGPRKSIRRRRRSGMGAGIGSMFSNPIIGAATGAVAAGLIGGFLAKPGASGKPFIESPVMRAALAGGLVFALSKFVLKAPAVGIGGVAVATFGIIKNSGVAGQYFALSEGAEINYVNPALLSEATTLADSATLAQYGGAYSAARY